MKKIFYFSLVLIVSILSSCEERYSETVTYKINEPIFMSAADFRSSVKLKQENREIQTQGKICFYQGYLYISEPEIGIHIIDNRDPANPQNIAFIELLGNSDLAIRNNQLYADSYIDLLWFDISNPSAPEYSGRIESIFPKAIPATDNEFGIDYNMSYGENRDDAVIVDWELKERTEDIDHYSGGWLWWGMESDALTTTNGGGSTVGVSGSMSRFALYKDNLYTVIENYMSIFDLTGDEPAKAVDNIYIGWNVETLFSYEDNMFMGTPTGMLIYSVEDPLKPVFQSSVIHIFGCDPVVVHNDLAYVTIHSGNNCGQDANELIIVDVSNVQEPKKMATYAMKSPKGLGIDKEMLFLCDDGLKIYSITSPEEMYLKSLKHIEGMDGYDLIAFDNVLMMIAEDGIYQYDYSDINNIYLLSKMLFAEK
jgi:hypothetical protein